MAADMEAVVEEHPLYAINGLADSGAQFRLLAFWQLKQTQEGSDAGALAELETIQMKQNRSG